MTFSNDWHRDKSTGDINSFVSTYVLALCFPAEVDTAHTIEVDNWQCMDIAMFTILYTTKYCMNT